MAKALGPTQVSPSYLSPKGRVNFTVPLSVRVTPYRECLSASEQCSAGGHGRATHPVLEGLLGAQAEAVACPGPPTRTG